MANLKETRTRIASVNSTKQITSAMKMVSASKLRRATNAIIKMRPYALKLQEILSNLSASQKDDDDNVYVNEREAEKILFVVIASNRGLCGAFNANVIKETNRYIKENYPKQAKKGNVKIISIGKKVTDFFHKKSENQLLYNLDDLYHNLTFENVAPEAEKIMQMFSDRKFDKIEIVYNKFKNAATQLLEVEQFLPVKLPEIDEDDLQENIDYIFEPDKATIVNEIIPKSLKIQFYKTLLDSNASEHGARMTAMHKATDNATELLKNLKLTYNKARQAAITTEILEIVSGAEALKG
ncbi:MAG: ATP synthase F1 subunit gamma [Saprospiraceae bacterium]|nr:ATP synthase F1 subunit gamma [Saprospiraceae bacterium]